MINNHSTLYNLQCSHTYVRIFEGGFLDPKICKQNILFSDNEILYTIE